MCVAHFFHPNYLRYYVTVVGLETFLNGKTIRESEIDPRGPTIPDPPVSGLEELLERNAKALGKAEAASPRTEKESQPKKKRETSAEIDVSKLDIRVGVITKAWEHEEADKLFCEEIDIGEDDGARQIASGLREHYNVQDLEGQRVLVLANLKTRKMMGFPSHGMVLCAASSDGQVRFLEPPADAEIGERVFVEGYDGEPATENQVIKKKMLNLIFPDLKTDGNGVATYRDVPLKTSAGPCRSILVHSDVA